MTRGLGDTIGAAAPSVAELEQELADCRAALRSAVDDARLVETRERRRIAAGIHDDLGQLHATIKLRLNEIGRRVDDDRVTTLVDDATRLLDDAITATRSLSFELLSTPAEDPDRMLAALCARTAQDHGVHCAYRSDGAPATLGAAAADAMLHVVAELLSNVARHAAASSVTVDAVRAGDRLHVAVCDDGRGFESASGTPGSGGAGLVIARQRLAAVGGELAIRSGPGGGSTVAVTLSLDERSA